MARGRKRNVAETKDEEVTIEAKVKEESEEETTEPIAKKQEKSSKMISI